MKKNICLILCLCIHIYLCAQAISIPVKTFIQNLSELYRLSAILEGAQICYRLHLSVG